MRAPLSPHADTSAVEAASRARARSGTSGARVPARVLARATHTSRFSVRLGTDSPIHRGLTKWSERFRWKNERFDGLVDQMGQTAVDNPALTGLFHQAMEIWLRELPAIPLVQWFHRIPHNQTYWTGWPTAEDPYINSAYWHRTWLRVLLRLEPTQP